MNAPRADRRARAPPLQRLVAFATCLALLHGCATVAPPAAVPPRIEVPAAWSVADAAAAQGATSLAQWWLRFDDPLLATLVSQAALANTTVRSAQGALRQARAQRDVTAASLGAVQVSIAAEVGLAYIGLRGAQGRLTIAESNLAIQRETLQLTQWRLQAGLVTELGTEQARASVEQTRAQIPALQTSIEQARHALAVLTGRPPAALAATLAASAPVPQVTGELVLSIPAETLRQRPDVRLAEHQVTAALARVAHADRARAPSCCCWHSPPPARGTGRRRRPPARRRATPRRASGAGT